MVNIVDSHVHLVTKEMMAASRSRFSTYYPKYRETIAATTGRLFHDAFLQYLSESTLHDMAKDWIKALDDNDVDHAIFFPIAEELEQVRDFVKFAPDRFSGYAFLNDPKEKSAPEKLRKAATEYNLKGLKLYPPVLRFNAYDEELFPLYEEAQSLGIPITFHFGITLAPIADYRYANPIDLQLPSRLFPKLRFIIAHFGAGFFRETCLLGFHCENIYLDSSGTNNWREYTPEKMPLEQVMKRAIDIYGTGRILFGTDTVLGREKGYRTAIKKEQAEILDSLRLTQEEKGRIMGGNAMEIYGIR